MHTASYPPQSYGRAPVYELKHVRSQGFSPNLPVDVYDATDDDDALMMATAGTTRGSRWRRIAVRLLGYLAIGAVLYLFARVMMENPAMRRAVLDFVTFGHAESAHRAAQWLAAHGISIR
jgi:hypothetical protein